MARSRIAAAPALTRLEIRDLVVIANADLELGPGLTAITGETGAGKTVLATALGLLAGAAADAKAVRPGAGAALVQAEISLPDGYWDADADGVVSDLRALAEDPAAVCIARRIPASGRSRTLLDGQVAARDQVAALVRSRLRFSGQHEQRRLTGSTAQMEILDRFAGPRALALAAELATARRQLAAAGRALEQARSGRDQAIRERAELEELIETIDAAGLDAGEEAQLRAERERLVNLDALAGAVGRALAALSPEDGEGGGCAAAGIAQAAVAEVVGSDPGLAPVLDTLITAAEGLSEASLIMNRYLSDLEAAPGALDGIEERLDLYGRLSRRYGPGTEAVLARAEQARERLATLGEDADSEQKLLAAHAAALSRARELAAELSTLRSDAAPRLAVAVEDELSQLAMPAARFRVELSADGSEEPARERCSFRLRVNPGLPEGALSDVASGGELSRVLLALHGVAAGARDGAAWVFDEVDAGIGGRTAVAVGERLRALSAHHQVIVITHLPQVAALADAHYRLVKESDGATSTTRIEPLRDPKELVAELCRMLGSAPGDEGARSHAAELLARR